MTEPAAEAVAATTTTATTQPSTNTTKWAPIKAEFLIPREPVAASETAAATTTTPADDAAQSQKRKATNQKGSWVKRTGTGKDRAQRPVELCRATALGRACTFAHCKRSHDGAAFLAAREPDLPGQCPSFAQHGVCAYGLACRFVGSHLDAATSALVVDEARQAANPPPTRTSALTIDQQRAIERRQAKTPRADAFWTVRDSPDADLAARKRAGEVRPVDFRQKLVLAPLTTVGHAAFRRICKSFGADITVSEMALAHELVQGKGAEWALLRRHSSEDVFGIQLASGAAQAMAQAIELVRDFADVSADYISLNAGCPLDMLCNHGGGAQLSCNPNKLRNMLRGMATIADVPVELKIRTGRTESEPLAHTFIGELHQWGVAAVTLHGRSRRSRYTEPAQRDYMLRCAAASTVPFIANGDIYSFEDAVELWSADGGHVAGLMIGRGALIKPWLFQEIKERRHIDIAASERLEIVRQFSQNALDLFGSDARGVANARRYLCEWLSFAHRYVPVGILERMPSHLHEKPAPWRGRNELETLLGSPVVADWVKISNMFLGEAPSDFQFEPKHQSQAYAVEGAASDGVQG